MIRLSKEKQKKIALIATGTLALSAALWYLLINPQNKSADKYRENIRDVEDKIYKAERLIKNASAKQAELKDLREQIAETEAQMIPVEQLHGKKWLLDKVNQFIGSKYDLTPTGLSNEPLIEKTLLLPKFSYSAAAYELEVLAHYHEFGKFLADFENTFPYFSVQRLKIWPVATPSEAGGQVSEKAEDLSEKDRERLKISMKLVLLFRPGGSQ